MRVTRHVTQVELAGIVGIEQPNLSAYENDRLMPSADVLNRILAGYGYLLEATAGERRIVCPLPGADWPDHEETHRGRGPLTSGSQPVVVRPQLDDELSALKLEQVLALADSIRWSRAES